MKVTFLLDQTRNDDDVVVLEPESDDDQKTLHRLCRFAEVKDVGIEPYTERFSHLVLATKRKAGR